VFELYAGQAGNQSIRDAMDGKSDHNTNTLHGVHWESWYVPVRDEDGAVLGCAGITMDVTSARNREHELQAKLDVIEQQQRLIRGLSTPIIEVWDRVLTVPMIGLVDSTRAADLMDSLLQAVTRTRSRFAVLDLTGIDALDTASASGLVR
jgi:rsbT co-antagonist protein RsbR